MNKLIDLVIGVKKYYENNRNRIGSGASLFATTPENAFNGGQKGSLRKPNIDEGKSHFSLRNEN